MLVHLRVKTQYKIRRYPFIHLGGERHPGSKGSRPGKQHYVPGQASNPDCSTGVSMVSLSRSGTREASTQPSSVSVKQQFYSQPNYDVHLYDSKMESTSFWLNSCVSALAKTRGNLLVIFWTNAQTPKNFKTVLNHISSQLEVVKNTPLHVVFCRCDETLSLVFDI